MNISVEFYKSVDYLKKKEPQCKSLSHFCLRCTGGAIAHKHVSPDSYHLFLI